MPIKAEAMVSTALVVAALFVFAPFPASAEPQFSHYPATGSLQGEPVHPDYTADAAMYRTMIRRGIESGPNAGGYYVIIPIGCGSSCTVVEMVDLRNGTLLDFPVGGEEFYQLALAFKRDSRLIVADWKDPSDGRFNRCVRRFYEIADGEVILLRETSRPVGDYAVCSE
ncbi:MAG TPA: hypothetical protein VFF84_01620 [Sphingobium sp.]|nr:hypothetical protein [Sphingobium sp.]